MSGLTVIAVCAALLIFFGALFAYEDRQEKRLFETSRGFLDRVCTYVHRITQKIYWRFLNGGVRLALLYIIHTGLSVARQTLGGATVVITQLQRRNKQIARSITKKRSNSGLTAIVEDRKNNELSDGDKAALKARSLEGN